MKVKKIISGGQTGADRAALDFAIEHSIPYGGWVPRGRKAEDGAVPDIYELQEMPDSDYSKRTEKNILDSDGTLIVSHGILRNGSALTQFLAERHGKPCLHADLNAQSVENAAVLVNSWIDDNNIKVLNVAGPRARKDPAIYSAVLKLLGSVFMETSAVQ